MYKSQKGGCIQYVQNIYVRTYRHVPMYKFVAKLETTVIASEDHSLIIHKLTSNGFHSHLLNYSRYKLVYGLIHKIASHLH